MKVYQVLNQSGNPASNDLGDLCIFPTYELATGYISYLVYQCNCNSNSFRIVTKHMYERNVNAKLGSVLHVAWTWLPDDAEMNALYKEDYDNLKEGDEVFKCNSLQEREQEDAEVAAKDPVGHIHESVNEVYEKFDEGEIEYDEALSKLKELADWALRQEVKIA